ncbi:CIA30 family protein [Rhodophyticola porphyridii]|uniref:NADH ubiquinone oxidoreductase n=1 Tax=Rhodophyticola porphyridii TaxID=1852017 RepID=A0A3L9YC83_9RHOB|nr:CIA30 family protein [Rhodophyticola porphyridii]RMA43616.1 NADH ubiquinone oxidoreductase [Rhodophyticola porphyridii]
MTPANSYDWTYLADTVMGGVSEGNAALHGEALRLSGSVSTENRGGFIQARTALPDGLPPAATALRLRVRGNEQRYFIHLRTTGSRLPWQYYQAGFDAPLDWVDVTIPLADFTPSGGMLRARIRPEDIRSLGLVAYGRDHQADVSLAALGAI